MRTLGKERLNLITSIVAEKEFAAITAGLLEKDEHLTDALEAIFELKFEHVSLVFCGGTSLSKGHALIERMSEDADIKIVLSPEASDWGPSKLRTYLGGKVRDQIKTTLTALGFVEDEAERRSLNSNRYIHSQWAYARTYDEASSLRPNLQIELTVRTPALPTEILPLGTLADRLTHLPGKIFEVETVSVAETEAEKVLSFLRRFGQDRAGQMNRPWDTALVRHIYDVHCINAQLPNILAAAIPAFAKLVEGDRKELGTQHPDFMSGPKEVLTGALKAMGSDQQTRDEYDKNLLPLIYGKFKPNFDDSFASFKETAQTLLDSLT